MSKPKAAVGDLVLLKTRDKEFSGTLMPRPKILRKGTTVIKLENGYNIGIENSKIISLNVKKKSRIKKKAKGNKKKDPDLPNITIISLGGTIASRIDYKTGGVVADYTAEDFLEMYPELSDIANISVKIPMQIMSEDITARDWLKIAKIAADELNRSDGVVITLGTDVLHFTSAALAFLLPQCPRPVIFTAAQRSIDRGSSDAYMNLTCAVHAAAGYPGSGVFTCLHATTEDTFCDLIPGTRVRKMHSSRRDAFRPINTRPAASVYPDGRIDVHLHAQDIMKRDSKKQAKAAKNYDDKVEMLYTYPGMDVTITNHFRKKGVHGIVIAATGLGNVPKALFSRIEEANKAGIAVVITTQTLYGSTHELVYSNLRELSVKLGCIFVKDMLPEVAFVKLGYVLAQTRSKEKIKELMRKPLAKEICEKVSARDYLN